MAAKGNIKLFQNNDYMHISFEDQQKINKFAKHTARMDGLKEELEFKKNDLKNLNDASDEIEFLDENEHIPFRIGDVFMLHKLSKTRELLQEATERTTKEIADIEAEASVIKGEMNKLKAQLYQRFGSSISLEDDDDD